MRSESGPANVPMNIPRPTCPALSVRRATMALTANVSRKNGARKRSPRRSTEDRSTLRSPPKEWLLVQPRSRLDRIALNGVGCSIATHHRMIQKP